LLVHQFSRHQLTISRPLTAAVLPGSKVFRQHGRKLISPTLLTMQKRQALGWAALDFIMGRFAGARGIGAAEIGLPSW